VLPHALSNFWFQPTRKSGAGLGGHFRYLRAAFAIG